MLNSADVLYLLGLDMDPSTIHRQLRGLEVTSIDSKYHKNCKVNQKVVDAHDLDPEYPHMGTCQVDEGKYMILTSYHRLACFSMYPCF